MAILRKRQIENLEQMTPEQLEAFLDSLPAGQQSMSDLLDYVEDELYDTECDHTLRFSMRFMMESGLNFPKITNWLNENGGYCDCKVMEQIAPLWRGKFGDDSEVDVEKRLSDDRKVVNNVVMNTLSIQFPDSVRAVFGNTDDLGNSILVAAVVKWYELGRVSQGKASEILGLSRSEFLDLLASYQVSAWQYTGAEIDEELALG